MSKKKLLITLGCSYTEGVGCYLPELLEDNKPILSFREVYDASTDRFHTMGWPAQLQKKLQYDCLYNLGRGAASNSQIVKKWFEVFSDINLSEQYDVLVVWLVTLAGRISFYRRGKVQSLLPDFRHQSEIDQKLYDSYVQFLGNNFNKDIVLETYFYVNVIKHICELNNYKFFYLNVDDTEGRLLDSLLKTNSSLNFTHKKYYPQYKSVVHGIHEMQKLTAFCGHPNEKGYEVMADRIFTMIDKDYPELINREYIPPEYTMKYLGEPRQW